MKHLFRKLLGRKASLDPDTEAGPDSDTRRLTLGSPSPLNKVLVKPATAVHRQPPNAVERVLGNTDLDVAEEEFNPYNTSAFDRASSWDKISRQKKR